MIPKRYEVRKHEDGLWYIVEKQTDLLIARYLFKRDADRHAKKMDRGAAFMGNSPAFVAMWVNGSQLGKDQVWL